MEHIEQVILEAAQNEWKRKTTGKTLRERAALQRADRMEISADFTDAIASIIERWETHGYTGAL